MRRSRVLRQLIADSLYVVDEGAVADAILLRTRARATLPDVVFPNDRNPSSLRSFRLEHEARSFRLGGRARSRQLHR
jgi:hypothetical protein